MGHRWDRASSGAQAWAVRRRPSTALSSRTGLRRVLAAYCPLRLRRVLHLARGHPVGVRRGRRLPRRLRRAGPAAPRGAARRRRSPASATGCRAARRWCWRTAWSACHVRRDDARAAARAPVPVVIAAPRPATTAIAVVRPIHFAALPQLAATPGRARVGATRCRRWPTGRSASSVRWRRASSSRCSATGRCSRIATLLACVAAALCLGLRAASRPWSTRGRGRRTAGGARGDPHALGRLGVARAAARAHGRLRADRRARRPRRRPTPSDVLGLEATGAGLLIGSLGIGGLVGAVAGASLSRGRRLAPVIVTAGWSRVSPSRRWPSLGALTPAWSCWPWRARRARHARVGADAAPARHRRPGARAGVRDPGEHHAARDGARARSSPVAHRLVLAARRLRPARVSAAPPRRSERGRCSIRRLDARAVYRPLETALLRGVPFLSVLPEYDIERLAKNARWYVVLPGTVVIRQGDTGRQFYVVAEGELAVTVDGVRRPVTLGPGAGFGEIALLHAVPAPRRSRRSRPARLLVVEAATSSPPSPAAPTATRSPPRSPPSTSSRDRRRPRAVVGRRIRARGSAVHEARVAP